MSGTTSVCRLTAMMMALLIYSYAQGIFSSRQIERATHYHLGRRYLCANEHPDHAAEEKKKHRYEEARQRSREIRRQLRQKADSAEGRRLLPIRKTTVEPAFGWIKSVLGFRRFSLRGLENVKTEWQLIALAFNCRRISRHWSQN